MQLLHRYSPVHASSTVGGRSRALGRREVLRAGGLGALGLALTACAGSGPGGSSSPTVIVGCYGVQYVAELVAGTAAEVVSLAGPGQEPHDVELTIAQGALVEKADVVIRIPGFQPALDDVIAARGLDETVLDVSDVVTLLPADEAGHDHAEPSDGGAAHSEDDGHDHGEDGRTEDDGHASGDGHDHGALDPHFWTDPTMLAAVATELGARLDAHAGSGTAFADRAAKAVELLNALDTELRDTFAAVPEPRVFVTSHAAFGYLAHRYGLTQVGITGIDPQVEPSPQRLLTLQDAIVAEHVSTVFFEKSASPKVAQTLADRVGVRAAALDNLETRLSPDRDYPDVMRANAAELVASWR